MKLRVFEGARQVNMEVPAFGHLILSATYHLRQIQGDFSLERQKSQISKVFNLEDVNLLTEADLFLDIDNPAYMRHYFRLNGHQYTHSDTLVGLG